MGKIIPIHAFTLDSLPQEFEAALQYLLMGAHFAQDTVNLMGFADIFFEHADEERQHGIMFIEYLRLRGDIAVDFFEVCA